MAIRQRKAVTKESVQNALKAVYAVRTASGTREVPVPKLLESLDVAKDDYQEADSLLRRIRKATSTPAATRAMIDRVLDIPIKIERGRASGLSGLDDLEAPTDDINLDDIDLNDLLG